MPCLPPPSPPRRHDIDRRITTKLKIHHLRRLHEFLNHPVHATLRHSLNVSWWWQLLMTIICHFTELDSNLEGLTHSLLEILPKNTF